MLLRKAFVPVILVVAMLTALSTSRAQTARDGGGGGGNAQLIQQLQQLGTERTQMQAENSRLKGELEELRKERDALKAGQQSSTARERATAAAAARGTEQRAGLEEELARQKERMQELVAEFRETAQMLRDIETDRATKTQTLATRERELEECVTKNRALYDINREILDRYEGQGVWSSLASKEPFTRLKRTQLENMADEYRGRAEDQRISGEGTPAGSPPPPGS